MTREEYPMFVLPVPTIFQITEILPHQDMLKTGQLVRVTAEHLGKIIFISHEWTGFTSPDPRGDQLRCLQALLGRLAAGEEDNVQSTGMQQLAFKTNVQLRAKDWKTHLMSMFLCKTGGVAPGENASKVPDAPPALSRCAARSQGSTTAPCRSPQRGPCPPRRRSTWRPI